MNPRHRHLRLFRGRSKQTAEDACALIAGLASKAVLWIGGDAPAGVVAASRTEVRRMLGRSFDAVVIDLHDGLDADVVGQAHGFVWGGGVLVLRLPELYPVEPHLAAYPYEAADVGQRFRRRFEEVLLNFPTHDTPPTPVHATRGTAEQAELVEVLVARLNEPRATLTTVLAGRGRGKSSALGLALRHFSPDDVVLSAPHSDAVAEVLRFCDAEIPFALPSELLKSPERAAPKIIVVDEAAQIPIPVLRRLTQRFPQTHLVFATTTHGYEGTGRGFVLRFIDELDDDERPHRPLSLDEPIRWAADDPLEATVFEALLLDAEPADASLFEHPGAVEARRLDRDALVGDEALLREFFGLLIHAHYRTTPSDLHRMLDAPNLHLHALLASGHVVAATWVAEEGALPPELTDDVYWGRTRLRGHALTETLISHLGHPEAGAFTMMRSVRIAVHPAFRRLGLGSRLVEHIHAAYTPDLFGTVFGATPELLAFRRQAGYELVRISASFGARTGEPAVAMMRPVSPRADALVEVLRGELARDLPLELELLQQNGLLLDHDLVVGLEASLPTPAELSTEDVERTAANYAHGPRTYESAASALEAFVKAHAQTLDTLAPSDACLLRARVLERRSWAEVTKRCGFPTVNATMRALRRAFRALLRAASPSI